MATLRWAAGGMAEKRGVGIFHGLEQAVGHLGGTLVEMGMDAGDDQIHLFEDRVGEAERAIGEDIAFDSGENSNALNFSIAGPNTFILFVPGLTFKPMANSKFFGVVVICMYL